MQLHGRIALVTVGLSGIGDVPDQASVNALVDALARRHARQQWTALLPMHRCAQPAEIAGVAGFLCSDNVTGHVLAVDGGFVRYVHRCENFVLVHKTKALAITKREYQRAAAPCLVSSAVLV